MLLDGRTERWWAGPSLLHYGPRVRFPVPFSLPAFGLPKFAAYSFTFELFFSLFISSVVFSLRRRTSTILYCMHCTCTSVDYAWLRGQMSYTVSLVWTSRYYCYVRTVLKKKSKIRIAQYVRSKIRIVTIPYLLLSSVGRPIHLCSVSPHTPKIPSHSQPSIY